MEGLTSPSAVVELFSLHHLSGITGVGSPLIEHYLDGRSKPFCIQGPSRTYPQAGHMHRQSNLLGEALSEIGYRIQCRIEGKWFRPRVHP
jgi:hypothetical protein